MKRVLPASESPSVRGQEKRPASADAMSPELADPSFSRALVAWQKRHGRHQLPWQQTRDAYRIWLSEIMLQQTQVATVIPYYARFLERFPDVRALAAASVGDVMALWAGLGYYTRARNLHRCAQVVVERHGGAFPREAELLAELPGIGPSTAAAVAAFAYGARAAILDGNVKRVFCRVFGIEGFPGQSQVEKALWQRASALLPDQDIEAYTQGLMDLGATVCTRSRPDCDVCPMQARCVAYETQRTVELPARKPKKAVPEKSTVMLVVLHKGEVLLEQRPPQGIWGGLLSLPELSRLGEDSLAPELGEIALALSAFGDVQAAEPLPVFTHAFTHYRLQVLPLKVTLGKRTSGAAQAAYAWHPLATMAGAALPSPVRKLIDSL